MESIGRTWWHGFGWRLAEVPLAGSLKLWSGDEGGHGSRGLLAIYRFMASEVQTLTSAQKHY